MLQISDLSQTYVVLFDNLLPTRIQLHNAPLVEALAPIGKKL